MIFEFSMRLLFGRGKKKIFRNLRLSGCDVCAFARGRLCAGLEMGTLQSPGLGGVYHPPCTPGGGWGSQFLPWPRKNWLAARTYGHTQDPGVSLYSAASEKNMNL